MNSQARSCALVNSSDSLDGRLEGADEVARGSDQVCLTPVDAEAQRALFPPETGPVIQDAPVHGVPKRMFFPCNREDALLLLAGLSISVHSSDRAARLATAQGELAIVEDGLRLTEEGMLCGSRSRAFPLLIEVRPEVELLARQALEFGHIVQLVFRSKEDAEAFRFRPVDEFDTQTFACVADSNRFELPGDARFELRTGTATETMHTVGTVDRVLAGIHSLLSLADAEPGCRGAAAIFLSQRSEGDAGAKPDTLSSLYSFLTDPLTEAGRSAQGIILRSFASADAPSATTLLDAIAEELTQFGRGPSHVPEMELKWLETARDVARNRKPLSGDLLSDEKRVFLRGALLALMADSTEALVSFRRAEKPAGPRVTAIAAFLVGLKQGLCAMSWQAKGKQASQLSAAAGTLIRATCSSGMKIEELVSVEEAAGGTGRQLRITVGGVQLAQWASDSPTG